MFALVRKTAAGLTDFRRVCSGGLGFVAESHHVRDETGDLAAGVPADPDRVAPVAEGGDVDDHVGGTRCLEDLLVVRGLVDQALIGVGKFPTGRGIEEGAHSTVDTETVVAVLAELPRV